MNVYHADGLGSTRALADGSGNIIQTSRSDEFGVPTSTQGGVTQDLQYAGEQRDESGFVFLRARTYDPVLGRFLQRDPMAGNSTLPLSANRYAYVGNNPVMLKDPSGLCVDPGGSGLRYCIDRFIPTQYANFGAFQGVFIGDNRGASSSGGTFRVRQFFRQNDSGQTVTDTLAGVTYSTNSSLPGHEGFIYPGCGGSATKNQVLGGRDLTAVCAVGIGLLPPIPFLVSPIVTDIVIRETPGGGAYVQFAAGTPYPSLEVWQYGGPNGPQLLYSYDAQVSGTNGFDLDKFRLLPSNAPST